MRPPRHSISDEAVKADGGKRERQESEKGRECRNETLLVDRPVDFLSLSHHLQHEEVRVNPANGVAHQRNNRLRITLCPQREGRQSVLMRRKNRRLGLFSNIFVLCVAYNTDDLPIRRLRSTLG